MPAEAPRVADQRGEPLGSRYLLLEPIGTGVTGRVWRGSVRGTGAPVAVKVLHRELSVRPDVVTRFLDERSVLAGIHHPNVVPVVDFVVEGDRLAIVLGLADGDARALLCEQGTLAPADAVALVADVLAGLAAVHDAGLVHRDVKPENILVVAGPPRRFLLGDTGIATICGGDGTDLPVATGSPEYLAPEVVAGGQPGPAADLYAAGVVLYELLAGRTPFAGGHPAAVLYRQATAAPARLPGVAEPLWRVLASLLAKEPGARPAGARDARRRLLEAAAPAGGPLARPVPDAPPADDPARRRLPPADELRPAATDEPAPAGRRRHRRLRRLLAVAVAALMGAGVAGAVTVASDRGGGGTVATFAATPVRWDDGLVVTRTWLLAADRVSVRVTLTNDGAEFVSRPHREPLPPTLVATTAAARFRPPPDRTLDPPADGGGAGAPAVAEYDLGLAPAASRLVEYDVAVPASRRTLRQMSRWAAEQEEHVLAGRTGDAAPVLLAALDARPSEIIVAPGRAFRLNLSGTMADGSPATPAVLAGVAVTSTDEAVVAPRGATLVGRRAGQEVVVVQAGGLRSTIAVRVADPSSTPAVERGTVPPPAPSCSADLAAYQWALLAESIFTGPDRAALVDLTALAPAQPAWVVVEVANTGRSPWCRDGDHPVVVATAPPDDRPSPLVAPGWLSPSRPARLVEAVVAPGATGTFAFPVKAPTQPGPFREPFELAVEGLGRMEDIGFALDGTVVGPPLPGLPAG